MSVREAFIRLEDKKFTANQIDQYRKNLAYEIASSIDTLSDLEASPATKGILDNLDKETAAYIAEFLVKESEKKIETLSRIHNRIYTSGSEFNTRAMDIIMAKIKATRGREIKRDILGNIVD